VDGTLLLVALLTLAALIAGIIDTRWPDRKFR
jgi:hypothetical protein